MQRSPVATLDGSLRRDLARLLFDLVFVELRFGFIVLLMSWSALMVAITLAYSTMFSRRQGVRVDEILAEWMQAEITREWVTYKQAEELSGLSETHVVEVAERRRN